MTYTLTITRKDLLIWTEALEEALSYMESETEVPELYSIALAEMKELLK